jgi:hypothetical protein
MIIFAHTALLIILCTLCEIPLPSWWFLLLSVVAETNVIMVIHSLWVITYWLLRNCMQEFGSWASEWEKMMDACKIKTIFGWKIYGLWSNCWNTGNFFIIFPQKFCTIFAGKLISGTHTMGTPEPSNDITIFLMTDIRVNYRKCLNDQSDWQ